MILHATLAYSTRVTVPPSRAAEYRQVTFREAVDVPDLNGAQAPVAIEYEDRGEWTALRVHEGRLYVRKRPFGPAASLAAMASAGTLFGLGLQADAVAEDTVGLKGASAEMRQAAVDEARRHLVLVDGQAWTPSLHEPELHFDVRGDVATGHVSDRFLAPGEITFSMRDLAFVPAGLAAMFPERAVEPRLPRFRLIDATGFGRPCEARSLAVAGRAVAEEMKKGLDARSEGHLLAYARLRDACAACFAKPEAGDAVLGAALDASLRDALDAFTPSRAALKTVASRVARWDAYAEVLRARMSVEEDEVEALAGMSP